MLNMRSLTHVLRTLSNVRKTGVFKNIRLPEHALNVRFEKNYFNAWVVICKHKAFQGMVKCMFLTPCVKRMFFKTHILHMVKNIR